jgi:hypothetical protein
MGMSVKHWRWVRLFGYAVVCAVAGLSSLGLSFLFFSHRARAAQVGTASEPQPMKPWAVRSTMSFYDPSGRLVLVIASQYVRYTDRSMAGRAQQVYPRKMELLSHILDRQTEREVFLEPQTKSVTAMRLPRATQEKLTSSAWEGSCPVEDMKDATPGGVFFGHQTLHIVKNWGPGVATERWMIPELGCLSVKEIDTSHGARNVEVVESLQEGEPDRSWTEVPQDYTERSPAAVDDLLKRTTGGVAFGKGTRIERMYRERKLQ